MAMRSFTAAGVTASAALGGLSATVAYGSVSRSSQLFGPSVYKGPGNRRSIALTFDDGPSEGTLSLLEYLAKYGIKATFFQCGKNVRRLPQIAGEVAAQGHQIGNHTYSHPKLTFKSKKFIESEFTEAQYVIDSETGVAPMVLRAPYGFRWFGMASVQWKLGLLGVLWTVMGNDWRWPSHKISGHVTDRVSPGGIVCLHDGRRVEKKPDISATLRAVREIVPRLLSDGYTFETVSEILEY